MLDMLTNKEHIYLKDALSMENLGLAKFNVYADQCQDPELKDMMFRLSKIKRDHATRIKKILGSDASLFQ